MRQTIHCSQITVKRFYNADTHRHSCVNDNNNNNMDDNSNNENNKTNKNDFSDST